MKTTVAALAGLMLTPMAAFAQGETAPAVDPVVNPVVDPSASATATVVAPQMPTEVAQPVAAPVAAGPADGLVWDALMDTYWMGNLTGDPILTESITPIRAFDTAANSFTLAYAKIGAGYNKGPVGFRLDLGYGHTGAIVNGGSGSGSAGALLYSSAFLAQQAYATLRLLDGRLTLDMGRFATSAGSEVLESNKNWLYSRSLLFFGQPLLHTGLRATFKVSDMLSLQGAILNSISLADPDTNGNKSVMVNVAVTPNELLAAYATVLIGRDGPEGAENPDDTIFVDVVGALKLSDQVGLNLNIDYAKLGDANWFGLAAMGNFTVSEALRLAARLEYLKSKNLYGASAASPGLDGALYEVTLLAAFPFAGAFEARTEIRIDMSDKEIFMKAGEAKKMQATGLLSFLAWTN